MPEPFVFQASVKLPEYTGRKATTVAELLDGIQAAEGSSIFYHTFHFLYDYQYVYHQPTSDFAYWVGAILLDHGLEERLAAVNPVEFPSLHELKQKLIAVIREHQKEHRCQTAAPDGMNFFFMRSNSIVVQTPHVARDLESFALAMEKISISSIYHHLFEAKLRREDGRNDFSAWLETGFGLAEAARRIDRLDPFLLNLEGIRQRIILAVRTEGRTTHAEA